MASNRLELRWLKTVVVSVEEKAHKMCQVGTEKVSASESLLTCRKLIRWHQNRRCRYASGISLAVTRLLARRCPAWRRHELGLPLLRGTWEGAPGYTGPGWVGRGRVSSDMKT